MSDEQELMCGFCHTAWDIICGNIQSSAPLFGWIDHCHKGGCDPSIWDYVDANGKLDLKEPPPEYVPGLPRTELHKSRRPGPYRKEKAIPKARKAKKEAVTVPSAADGWSSDW